MTDTTVATETKKGYNKYARRMAYLRWRVDTGRALTPEQTAELAVYEETHARRAPKAAPAGPTEAQLKAREQLAQATKTDIKKTSKADLMALIEDCGFLESAQKLAMGPERKDITKGDLLEAAGLPREWAKS